MRSINFFAFIFLVGLFATSCHNNVITPVAGSLVVAVPGGRAASEDIANYKVDVTGTQEYTQTVKAGGVVTFSEVTPGSYTVTVSGLDKDGKTIFTGTGTTTVEAGKSASVTITLELNLIASGVMMWNATTGESGNTTYTGSLAPYGRYSSPDVRNISLQVSENNFVYSTVYCFDHRGNIYVQESADETTVVKKYLYQEDGSYTADKVETIKTPEAGDFSFLAYDNATDTLYGHNVDGYLFYYNKDSNEFVQLNAENSSLYSVMALAAHNNNVYFFHINSDGGYTLTRYPISSSSDGSLVLGTATEPKTITLDSSLGSNPECQMIFQDGALYLLLRNWEFSNSFYDEVDNYSLGALVKINPDTDTLSVDRSFGTDGYLGLASQPPQTWEDVVGKSSNSESNGTVHLTGPNASQETTHFYGPVGFVAIMPKKLVIADSGFTFSSTENNGNKTLALEKKSRIVTVDLETQAMDIANVSGYYEDKYVLSSGCGYAYITEETETAQ